MREIISNMQWEKWEEWNRFYKIRVFEPYIVLAENNLLPFFAMEEYLKNLFSILPISELIVLNEDALFEENKDFPEDCPGNVYRLIPGWQPPVKPKELVGEAYLRSLPAGTHVRTKEATIIVHGTCNGDQFRAVKVNHRYLWSHYEHFKDHADTLSVSASNSKIIWPEE